ncbi:MAG: bifunctional metallophosphatase/5'-nucleotidase [Candidatus Parabeggiatoa sp. nov. 2]|nr:MAG: bifunctional metallophosphatase/5'-nucleotidase [Gammaproteobacteria bacterium]
MKIPNYLFTIATAMLLSIGTASVQAQLCDVAEFDSTTGKATIPCVMTGGLPLSLELEPSFPEGAEPGRYWKLASSGFSTCQWTPSSCATLGEGLYLVIPVEGVKGSAKHVAGLAYYPTETDKFYWQYDFHEPVDTDNVVTLKQGTPNPNGGFESLYTFEGDFANFAPDEFQDFQMGKDVIPPQALLEEGDEVTLRIFHFNDLHNELRSVHSKKGDTHRFSQMVKIVKKARADAVENEIVLFLSGGDDHIGNPFDELLGFDVDSFQTDPAYTAYSAVGLDAAVIGNHELDRGTALFAKAIKQDATFPVLSANLYGSKNLTFEHYHPAIIGVAKGLRVGIIGLTTKQETLLRQKDDPQLEAGDLLTSLENTLSFVDKLADVIILLTHVGYNGETYTQVRHELEIGDVQIAEAAAKMTTTPIVVIGGHLHLPINTEGLNVVDKSVPILEAGAKGSHLGEAVYSLLQTEEGLRSHLTARLIPLKKRDDRVGTDDPDYGNYEHDDDIDMEFESTVMAPLYALLDDKLQEVIGTVGSSGELSTEKNIADRYVGETVIANFMNDAIVAQSVDFPEKDGQSQQVDIAIFNASGVSGGVEPNSDLTFNDWYGVMPYADMIVVTQMTGAQIKAMVVSNAQRIARPEELEGDNALNLAGFVSRGFLNFSKELRYTIKLNTDATTAIAQDITLNGKPIDEQLDDTFNVAFGDYIVLRGAEGWNGEKVGAGLPDGVIGFDLTTLPMNDTGLVYRNEIIAYIKEQGAVDESTGAVKDGRVQIIP